MTETPGDIEVRDNPDQSRYEAVVDGKVAGFAVYERIDGLIAFVHTEVDDAYSGLGMIRAQMGEHARAAAAFELARKWNPHIVGIDAEIERQKAEAGGEVADDPLGCGQRTAGR